MSRFAESGIKVPNYPVLDEERGWLYVSDSAGDQGGVFRYDLNTGEGGPWCRDAFSFANGMAMAPDRSGLFVVESDAPCISFVPIEADGSAGSKRVVDRRRARTFPTGSPLRLTARCSSPATSRAASTAGGRIADWNC